VPTERSDAKLAALLAAMYWRELRCRCRLDVGTPACHRRMRGSALDRGASDASFGASFGARVCAEVEELGGDSGPALILDLGTVVHMCVRCTGRMEQWARLLPKRTMERGIDMKSGATRSR